MYVLTAIFVVLLAINSGYGFEGLCSNDKICCPNHRGRVRCKLDKKHIMACCPGSEKALYNKTEKMCDGTDLVWDPAMYQYRYNKITLRSNDTPSYNSLPEGLEAMCNFKKSICCRNNEGIWQCKKRSSKLKCCHGATNPFYNSSSEMCDGNQVVEWQSDKYQCGPNKLRSRGSTDDLQEPCNEGASKKPLQAYYIRPKSDGQANKSRNSCVYKCDVIIPSSELPSNEPRITIYDLLLVIKEGRCLGKSRMNKWHVVVSKEILSETSKSLKVSSRREVMKISSGKHKLLKKNWNFYNSGH